jgi:hypothetical protein
MLHVNPYAFNAYMATFALVENQKFMRRGFKFFSAAVSPDNATVTSFTDI